MSDLSDEVVPAQTTDQDVADSADFRSLAIELLALAQARDQGDPQDIIDRLSRKLGQAFSERFAAHIASDPRMVEAIERATAAETRVKDYERTFAAVELSSSYVGDEGWDVLRRFLSGDPDVAAMVDAYTEDFLQPEPAA